MMSKLKPYFRARPSALGTFGVSMKPKRTMSRVNDLPSGSMLHREPRSPRAAMDSLIMVSTTRCSSSTL